ncbi:hypothetical protein [Cytobacillus sp. IB215665]|uniref:hypothetical protein n=1 Tax=Cytobacillus sp. IB215665 TaxID=3097357 RepID=UPI002A17515C|nr:hypothetical protein [Cytobacillus sp. IB215665]MDX8367886.1 hypothetical protein [Cytobacillus sp. IB215665]
MNIHTLEEHSKAVITAKKLGIFNIYEDSRVHLDQDVFTRLVEENNLNIQTTTRDCNIFPHEKSFQLNGIKYYSLF